MLKKIKTLTAIFFAFHFCTFGQVFKNEIKFDKSILNAKLVNSSESMDFYETTIKDVSSRPADWPIFALTYYASMNYQSAQGYIEHQKSYITKENKTIKNEKISDTLINGFKYHILTMTAVEIVSKKEEQFVYGFVLKDNKAAFFLGSTTGDKKYVKKLQETVFSIKV